jgi:hypothetical protein
MPSANGTTKAIRNYILIGGAIASIIGGYYYNLRQIERSFNNLEMILDQKITRIVDERLTTLTLLGEASFGSKETSMSNQNRIITLESKTIELSADMKALNIKLSDQILLSVRIDENVKAILKSLEKK